MNDKTLTIQQAAEATGLSEYTLRYYERIGLIHPISRAGNGHRRYSEADVGWINLLNKLRATGMSIQQMQQYAELHRQGDDKLPERLEILRAHRAQVEARMAELHENLQLICYKIELYQQLVEERTFELS